MKYSHKMLTVNEGKNITKHSKPRLDPGMAADFTCSEFEGDRKDLNEANTPNSIRSWETSSPQ